MDRWITDGRSVLDNSRYPKLPARLLANSRILPDRADILPLIPKGGVIIEVGVAFGDFSRKILDICQPRKFIAIDIFDLHEQPTLWGKDTATLFSGKTHADFYRHRFTAECQAGQVELIAAHSALALETLPDHAADVIYLDAEHSYEAVTRDLAICARKIHENGWLILNDYTPAEAGFTNIPYGVIQACHEFMLAHDWEMTHLSLAWVMYCDVVLRKFSRTAA